MSAKIMGLVWDLALPHSKQSILLAMADHADQQGNNVYPSIGLVAWKTGYSARQVHRIIQELVVDGLLVLVQDGSKSGISNKYRIDLAAGKQKTPYKNRETATRDIVSPHDKMSHPPMTSESHTPYDIAESYKPSIEPSINHPFIADAIDVPQKTTQNLSLNALAWNMSGLTPDQINGKGSYYGGILNGSPADKQNRMGLFDLLQMPRPKRGSPEDQALANDINGMYKEWPATHPGMNKPQREVAIANAIKDYRSRHLPTQRPTGFAPTDVILYTVRDGVSIAYTMRDGLPYDAQGNILPPEMPPKQKRVIPGVDNDDEQQF